MMTHQLEVSILAAPLGAIDRRALSQAWYSALRFSRQSPKSGKGPAIGGKRGLPHVTPAMSGAPRQSPAAKGPALRSRAAQLKRSAIACGPQSAAGSRASRSHGRLAERIESAFSPFGAYPKRATFSVGPANARVHVILQTAAGRTTLLAICRPELRGIVARALAQARSALAARGVGIEFCAIGAVECS